MLVIGVDENGLGPLLGPLVVTATAFESNTYDTNTFWKLAGDDLPADDSKVLFSRKNPGKGELAFLSWLNIFRVDSSTHSSLVKSICRNPFEPIPCDAPVALCEPSLRPLPFWASKKPTGVSTVVSNRFEQMGIGAHGIAAHQICPGLFNKVLAEDGMNKLRLDFEIMVNLVKGLGARHNGDVLALCGKIGSTRKYLPWFEKAGVEIEDILEETRARSTYKTRHLGTFSFIRDGDGEHLPIAVASMIGKYLRELAMERINTCLGRDQTTSISGYRDKLTARFVEDTVQARKRMSLENSCFLRYS